MDLHRFLGSGLDMLVVSTPLTERTRGLIGRDELAVLGSSKGHAFLSNISRGAVIDTNALVNALESNVIGGAAIDVTDPEPLPDGHELWSTKNLIITPHISGQSLSYGERALAILEANLLRFCEGKGLINEVSRKEGY
jgi:phosphoglycerate dehydrogenase-like enzyme